MTMTQRQIQERLEYLRGEIRAERISMGEIVELQELAQHIHGTDVELLEWADVKENEVREDCDVDSERFCTVHNRFVIDTTDEPVHCAGFDQ